MSSLTRDIASFLVRGQMLPLRLLIVGQMNIDQVSEDFVTFSKQSFDQIGKVVEYIIHMNHGDKLALAAYLGLSDEVDFLLSKDDDNCDRALAWAAFANRFEVFGLLISAGATDFNRAMENAAYAGHVDGVTFMLSKGANRYGRAIVSAKKWWTF